mmetsp:Transcript_23648/g.63288  ORF Transcript_23648/g.63288 Transcript_23648/m.63288 type:complete len:272 (+) Transcript_23648:639-1454(+)
MLGQHCALPHGERLHRHRAQHVRGGRIHQHSIAMYNLVGVVEARMHGELGPVLFKFPCALDNIFVVDAGAEAVDPKALESGPRQLYEGQQLAPAFLVQGLAQIICGRGLGLDTRAARAADHLAGELLQGIAPAARVTDGQELLPNTMNIARHLVWQRHDCVGELNIHIAMRTTNQSGRREHGRLFDAIRHNVRDGPVASTLLNQIVLIVGVYDADNVRKNLCPAPAQVVPTEVLRLLQYKYIPRVISTQLFRRVAFGKDAPHSWHVCSSVP